MKGKVIINPQDVLKQNNKMCINYQVQLEISKGKIKDLLAKITNPHISHAKYTRNRWIAKLTFINKKR